MPLSFDALLPDRDAEGKQWKTLYLLHGFGGDRNDWLLKTRLTRIVEGSMVNGCPLMVILPEGNNSFFVNLPNGHDYSDFLCEELIDFIGNNFPVSAGREDRLIAGFGMGGYGAFLQALSHPEKFSAAAAFEAPFDIGRYYQRALLPANMSLCMEQIFGREENFKGSGKDLFFLAEKCAKKEKTDLLLYHENGGPFEQDYDLFYSHVRNSGFPGIHHAVLPGKGWEFAESALGDMLARLNGGGE
ncbi:hypothetical protein AGMMS50255_0890 [Spirochaetia bacterium]|nr:hypothetical protein AGMMS50255_0890 [Spirochaetia bacterium]